MKSVRIACAQVAPVVGDAEGNRRIRWTRCGRRSAPARIVFVARAAEMGRAQ